VIKRRALIGVFLVAAIPVLSGCGLEVKDETSKESSPVQARDVSVGAIDVRNAFITYDTLPAPNPNVEEPLPVATASGSGGYLVVTLVNNGVKQDALTGVSSPLGTITPTGGSLVRLLPGIPVAFGSPGTASAGPYLNVASVNPAADGTNILVRFTFANAGSLTVPVPVVETENNSTHLTYPLPTPTSTETLPSEGLQPAPD
jgi:copper(I)-binding protein